LGKRVVDALEVQSARLEGPLAEIERREKSREIAITPVADPSHQCGGEKERKLGLLHG
jgi:hypothetical protein